MNCISKPGCDDFRDIVLLAVVIQEHKSKVKVKIKPSLCFVKEQRSFSWDWGPSFPTMGLWKEVRLVAFDELHLFQLSSVPLYGGSPDLVLSLCCSSYIFSKISLTDLYLKHNYIYKKKNKNDQIQCYL